MSDLTTFGSGSWTVRGRTGINLTGASHEYTLQLYNATYYRVSTKSESKTGNESDYLATDARILKMQKLRRQRLNNSIHETKCGISHLDTTPSKRTDYICYKA